MTGYIYSCIYTYIFTYLYYICKNEIKIVFLIKYGFKPELFIYTFFIIINLSNITIDKKKVYYD